MLGHDCASQGSLEEQSSLGTNLFLLSKSKLPSLGNSHNKLIIEDVISFYLSSGHLNLSSGDNLSKSCFRHNEQKVCPQSGNIRGIEQSVSYS